MQTIYKIFVVLFFINFGINAFSYERKPLTYRDWGLYCGSLYHVPKAKRPAGWKHYDPYFIKHDTPWDFFIIQVNKYEGEEAKQANKELNKIIDGLYSRKKQAILRILLFNKHEKAKSLDFYKKKIDAFFKVVDVNKIYAVIIDEETIFWNGYGQMLEPIYDYIKSKHPELPAFQFYTPMVTPDKHAKSGWKDLRGDGWISDVYCMVGDEFEKHIVKHIDLNKKYPLIHIIWASPTWPFGKSSKGVRREEWWCNFGRKQFDFQLKICREYNIPVAFFAAQPPSLKAGIYWAWWATDPVVKKEYRRLCGMARKADLIPEASIGFRKVNREKVAWAEAKVKKHTFNFDVDAEGDPEVTIVDLLEFDSNKQITVDSEFIKMTHFIKSGSELLTKRKSGLALGGHKGKNSVVELISKIEFIKPPSGFEYSISGSSVKALGGNIRISFSKDGKNWIDSLGKKKLEIKSSRNKSINISSKHVFGRGTKEKQFWVKCELINSSGVKTNISSRLESVKLTAIFPKGSFNTDTQ